MPTGGAGGGRLLRCSICNHESVGAFAHTLHVQTHSGENETKNPAHVKTTFEATLQPRRVPAQCELLEQARGMPYACPRCDRRFETADQLRDHPIVCGLSGGAAAVVAKAAREIGTMPGAAAVTGTAPASQWASGMAVSSQAPTPNFSTQNLSLVPNMVPNRVAAYRLGSSPSIPQQPQARVYAGGQAQSMPPHVAQSSFSPGHPVYNAKSGGVGHSVPRYHQTMAPFSPPPAAVPPATPLSPQFQPAASPSRAGEDLSMARPLGTAVADTETALSTHASSSSTAMVPANSVQEAAAFAAATIQSRNGVQPAASNGFGVCSRCGFRALSERQLKVHVRSHFRYFECAECNFYLQDPDSIARDQHVWEHRQATVAPACSAVSATVVSESAVGADKDPPLSKPDARNATGARTSVSREDHGNTTPLDLAGADKDRPPSKGDTTSAVAADAVARFRCRICDYSATQRSAIRRHMQVHTKVTVRSASSGSGNAPKPRPRKPRQKNAGGVGNKPKTPPQQSPPQTPPPILSTPTIFHCWQCTFKGESRQVLRKHQQLHTEAGAAAVGIEVLPTKPDPRFDHQFRCDQCRYSGRRKQDLHRHQKIHTAAHAARYGQRYLRANAPRSRVVVPPLDVTVATSSLASAGTGDSVNGSGGSPPRTPDQPCDEITIVLVDSRSASPESVHSTPAGAASDTGTSDSPLASASPLAWIDGREYSGPPPGMPLHPAETANTCPPPIALLEPAESTESEPPPFAPLHPSETAPPPGVPLHPAEMDFELPGQPPPAASAVNDRCRVCNAAEATTCLPCGHLCVCEAQRCIAAITRSRHCPLCYDNFGLVSP